MLGRKRVVQGEIHESHEDMTNNVLNEINVEGREVTVVVRSRVDGSTLLKAECHTHENRMAAHYTAEQLRP
ncbi:hypothetical protein [Rossellomorea marisflavi]|uniref:hypothetical protein n=1 Tax=Rossellomorea marisflavi TaxID=189381 RepID=UPI0009A630DF|nr:hypothetical protein [Rossellomorea marisflavi]